MATPHISAEPGQIAKTVLMPGDPVRAKWIADTYLDNAVCVSKVRGIFCFTGTYHGKPVSVMASGMGMPSIGIYSYELFKFYDVDNIIRIGSAGAYLPEVKVMDVVLADSAWSESAFACAQCGQEAHEAYPSKELNDRILAAAADMGLKLHTGRIHSSDIFYHDLAGDALVDQNVKEHHLLCVEMESFALFHNARQLGKNAACLLTISDSFVTKESISSEARATSFSEMVETALAAAVR